MIIINRVIQSVDDLHNISIGTDKKLNVIVKC